MRGLFTVVIAEQEHIDSIKQCQVFLQPFLDQSRMAFCPWYPEEPTLADSVPRLAECVAGHQQWRAVVVCGEEGLTNQNPFDVVPFHAPPKSPETVWDDEAEGTEDGLPGRPSQQALRDYLSQLRQAKFQAFALAAQQPLTRLMTRLCQWPLVTRGKNNASEDPEFAEYLAENARKQELREEIIGEEKLNLSLPQEVICIAKRTYTQQESDINTVWTPNEDIQYSRFYDWNMYFDKMRYLFYDILPKEHRDYGFDYLKFLYVLLIVACNETPAGVLKPNRVFRLGCDNNEEALRDLLAQYDAKLANTSAELEQRIRQIQTSEKARLSDRDAKQIFCANINVPVLLSQEIDRTDLYAKPEELGLATDCPESEEHGWSGTYLTSRRTLQRLLKMPRRALKSAVTDLRRLNQVDLDRAWNLNEFQVEDVQEYTSDAELNMVSAVTPDLSDTERYDAEMAEHDKAIRRKIDTRMTRGTTLALGISVLVLYLLGFLPLLLSNFNDPASRTRALLLMGGALGVLVLTGLVCLFFLRWALRKRYRAYNDLMGRINMDLDQAAIQYSHYLSQACNVMRGFQVLNFRSQTGDPDTMRVRVLKKHMADIKRIREELREVFGVYIDSWTAGDEGASGAYSYDFTRTVDFSYPVPYTDGMRCQIEFMQPGSTIQVPVDFIRRITVRREELYD